jgi:hypothetical protein
VARIPTGSGPNGISYSTQAPSPAPEAEIVLELPEHQDEGMPRMQR